MAPRFLDAVRAPTVLIHAHDDPWHDRCAARFFSNF
jgi:predicted alpha/beta-fold hydrolase